MKLKTLLISALVSLPLLCQEAPKPATPPQPVMTDAKRVEILEAQVKTLSEKLALEDREIQMWKDSLDQEISAGLKAVYGKSKNSGCEVSFNTETGHLDCKQNPLTSQQPKPTTK